MTSVKGRASIKKDKLLALGVTLDTVAAATVTGKTGSRLNVTKKEGNDGSGHTP